MAGRRVACRGQLMGLVLAATAALLLSLPAAHAGCQSEADVWWSCAVWNPCCGDMTCEAGSQACRRPGASGDPCHLTRPCGDGLTCQPGVQKCYHSPRLEGEPCVAGYGCADGLTCEAGSQVCRAAGDVGDPCHLTRPCGHGLTCQPGVQKCYHSPRLENEPCVAGYGCADGLHCEAGTQICRRPGDVGDACHLTRPCGDGLSCQPGVHKCYHSPRRMGEPCVAGYGCAEGLNCQPFIQICTPGEFDINNYDTCSAMRDPNLAAFAESTGKSNTYGGVFAASAGVTTSVEFGVAYGPDGKFGCYKTSCEGVITDLSVNVGFAFGIFHEFEDIEGEAYLTITGAEVDAEVIPISGGFTAALIFDKEGKMVGEANTLSIGLGWGSPVTGGFVHCTTELGVVGNVRPCDKPNNGGWCTHPGSTVHHVDCDGDGAFDWACEDKDGNHGVILSGQQCADGSWPNAPVSSCPAAFVHDCAKPNNGGWCTHPSSTVHNVDCDSDGHLDWACEDTAGNHGVILSTKQCADGSWPDAAVSSCPAAFLRDCDKPNNGGWCTHPGSTVYNVDCDYDGRLDWACEDKDGNHGVILSSNQCADGSWPNAAISDCPDVFIHNCDKPNNGGWCTHEGATVYNVDCDGDDHLDWACEDTAGNHGVILSSRQCADGSWPNAAIIDCPAAFVHPHTSARRQRMSRRMAA